MGVTWGEVQKPARFGPTFLDTPPKPQFLGLPFGHHHPIGIRVWSWPCSPTAPLLSCCHWPYPVPHLHIPAPPPQCSMPSDAPKVQHLGDCCSRGHSALCPRSWEDTLVPRDPRLACRPASCGYSAFAIDCGAEQPHQAIGHLHPQLCLGQGLHLLPQPAQCLVGPMLPTMQPPPDSCTSFVIIWLPAAALSAQVT